MDIPPFDEQYKDYTHNEYIVPFQGIRSHVAFTYIIFNIVGFLVNIYVLYVVGPLLLATQVKVPKSILFYILILCASDILTLSGMFLLIMELVLGTWKVSSFICICYMFFDSMNKFVAPIIVLLISRTCFATVCLNKKRSEMAASLRFAIPNVILAMFLVTVLLWPVFVYTEVAVLPMNINHTNKEVFVVKKCGFNPPPKIQFWFNIIACVSSYAIPLFGFIYWYMSVPFFLRKRAETTLIRGSTSSNAPANIALRKVTATVLVLTVVYISCWTPYWIMLFANQVFSVFEMSRTLIIIMYLVHLLPYVSCCAYPLIFTIMNRSIQRAHTQMVENQRRRIKSLTVDLTRHIREAFNFRLLDRDNALFPRSSISVATTAQRIALSSNSSSLQPPILTTSQSSASFSNVPSSLLESSATNETLVERHRSLSAHEVEAIL